MISFIFCIIQLALMAFTGFILFESEKRRRRFKYLCGIAQKNMEIYKELVDEIRKGGAK